MTDHELGARLNDSVPAEFPESLTARVVARVNDARLAVDRSANASRPKSRRRRHTPPGPAAADLRSPEDVRESESLRRVFRDLGTSYRRYRSQTREPVVPGLRDAAYTFRAEPSLASLVAVAAYLDELDLLS
jgi:hypothetical protein